MKDMLSSTAAELSQYTRIGNDPETTADGNRRLCGRYYRLRFFKSGWALLVLVWYLLIYLSGISSSPLFNELSFFINDGYSVLLESGCVAFTGVLCSVFAYFADAHIGRYKMTVIFSIVLSIGELLGCIQLFLKHYHHYTSISAVAVPLLLPCFILARLGMSPASFIIIFGMDQLKDSSSDDLTSYIISFVWVEMFGTALANGVNVALNDSNNYSVVTAATSCSVILVLWFFLYVNHRYGSRLYHREPLSASFSYGQTFRVLKFAVTHKHPLRRSAWTYCEDEKIPRIDLGKSRYGGPFTTEQVEDVKTLLWILLIIGISCLASLPIQAQFDKLLITKFEKHMNWATKGVQVTVIRIINGSIGVVAVSIHELVVFPLAGRCFPSVLKRLGILLLVIALAPCSYLAMDVLAARNASSVCMFQSLNSTSSHHPAAAVSHYGELAPIIISIVAYTFFHCTLLELIIAQSPEYFKSMTVSLMVAMIGFRYFAFEVLITIPFAALYEYVLPLQTANDFSCDRIFYLALIALGMIGFILYCVASRKYPYRRRDDIVVNENMYAEDYYSQGDARSH